MIRLDDLGLFVRTAALGSFSAAAREANLLPGQASAAIKRLERELDLRLFVRSTRTLRLTTEGEQYLETAREVLDTLHAGHERLRAADGPLSGVLRVAAPSDLGRNALLPWLTEFRAAHPALVLRLFLSDQVTDVFRDPVDVAFRLGRFEDARYVTLPLAPANRRVLVASPAYLAARGRPQSLDELRQHDGLLYTLGGRTHDQWAFEVDGRRQVVPMRAALLSDDAEITRRWAVAGQGIAYKSWLDVCDDVRDGRLVALFAQHGESVPLHLVCPHRKQFSPAIRQLHALLRPRFEALTDRLPTG
ncbi:transcriptional regulator /transcriptional regulator, LysR family [Pseudoxanthomonas sp. GM95]|uniref:LysR family transcriptional regulator n=1 Tax=Pseudoxanthomonas sp. GM95 TaxID=1881043 RepID=UPI0008C2949F|nr:LysR family transcriptional regulator [Pseudoxanthomonas sp. GM95]SEM22419.1 transcriptional regulator /transcriptional regulator, LysR family [Pseudoxanthomonas sp. GM95]